MRPPELSQGSIVLVDLSDALSHEKFSSPAGRPCVVVNNSSYPWDTLAVVVPLTSRCRGGVPDALIFEPTKGNGLRCTSSADPTHLRSISVDRILGCIGYLLPGQALEISEAVTQLIN